MQSAVQKKKKGFHRVILLDVSALLWCDYENSVLPPSCVYHIVITFLGSCWMK